MLDLRTRADLQRLIDEQIGESLSLEFKASSALDRADHHKRELARDVSAFANSAGGQIVYGLAEREDRYEVDDGIDPNHISKEWIERVIDTSIFPRIEGLIIDVVALGGDRVAYVVSIPQATSRAPHQAPDHRYYRRQNFQNVPMQDYEIRDMLRRGADPEPFLDVSFEGGRLQYPLGRVDMPEQHRSVPLHMAIGNHSKEPAYYSILTLVVDNDLRVQSTGEFNPTGNGQKNGTRVNYFTRRFSIPEFFPLFREAKHNVSNPPFRILIDPQYYGTHTDFLFGYEIKVPGSAVGAVGFIQLRDATLTLTVPVGERL